MLFRSRGHRVPYDGELASTPVDTMVQAIQNYYMLYLLLGLGVAILGILIMRKIVGRKKTPKEGRIGSMPGVKAEAIRENETENEAVTENEMKIEDMEIETKNRKEGES